MEVARRLRSPTPELPTAWLTQPSQGPPQAGEKLMSTHYPKVPNCSLS